MRPIRARKVLVQCGQGMVAAVGDLEDKNSSEIKI